MRRTILVLMTLTLSVALLVAVIYAIVCNRDDYYIDKFDQVISQLLEKYKVPGVAVSLVHNGEIAWSQGYGLADWEQDKPVTTDTVFQVASISKAVTSWGVMRLVERGQLELDVPIEKYLTRWHLPSSKYDASGVTIRRLLSHSAGLSVDGYPGLPPDVQLPSLEESLAGNNGGAGELRIIMEPGAQFSYSGGGFTLLQLIIEEVTGETFSAYMQREVLDPLGMVHSSFEWRADLRPVTAVAYSETGASLPNYLFTEQAAAGLYSTASDMARFLAAEMPGPNGEPVGRGVLSSDTLALMFTPVIQFQGLGQGVSKLPDGSKVIEHGGSNKGWKAVVSANPGHSSGIVILTNSDNGTALYQEIYREWFNSLIMGSAIRILILILALGLLIFAIFLIKDLTSPRQYRHSNRNERSMK
jgi:CubicO group peptidase (beta-lactamase class C family)